MQPTPPPPYPYAYPPQPPPRSSNTALIVVLAVVGGVVLIGIMAAVAIPQFLKYQKKSKTSAAELSLRRIGRGVEAYVTENATLPASAPLTPSDPCCEFADRRCPAEMTQWGDEAWEAILFDVETPSDYQYSLDVDQAAGTFTATAIGDLDCDGETASYVLKGRLSNGVVVLDPVIAPAHPD